MLTQLLTETFLGALTGYITNDTAIRSLFKPNGVIEQTRDDFAREAGKLLESQVLTQSVLAHQLSLPEVQDELARALHTFFQKELPAALGDSTVLSLSEQERMLDRLQEILLKFAQSERDTILQYLKQQFPVATILTPAQWERLANTLETLLLDVFQDRQFAQRIWQGWYAQKGACTPEELELSALCRVIVSNLGKDSKDWNEIICGQYGAQIRAAAEASVQKFHLETVLLELDAQMAQYPLRQYLNGSVEELAEALQSLLHSEQGKQLLQQVVAEVLSALQAVDLPIRQLVPADLLDSALPLLQQVFPAILEELLEWIWENKQSVQQMLEDTVDEIAMETGGVKGTLLQQLKDSLLGELMQSADTYGMLRDVLAGEGRTEETVEWLMAQLRVLLTENTVGQLVLQLNQKGNLQSMAYEFLYENLERYLTKGDTAWLEGILAMRPGSLHLAQKQKEIEGLLVQALLVSLEHMEFAKLLQTASEPFFTMPLEQSLPISREQFAQILQDAVHGVCGAIADTMPQVESGTLYGALYDTILWWLENQSVTTMELLLAQWPLAEGVRLAAGVADTQTDRLTQSISQVGLNLMQGQLSVLAENQIQALSSAEMLELVEDFMGRELQPLNYLGAGMGAVAGATVGTALSTAIPAVSMVNPMLAGGVLAGKAAVFGAVGYTTNCAAVKGLFWPYAPVGGIRTLQGVIPKQKERFAGSMGRLVDRYVINDTILKEQIALLRDNAEIKTLSSTLAEDTALFDGLFAELSLHRKQIAAPICDGLLAYGTDRSAELLAGLGKQRLSFLHDAIPMRTPQELECIYEALSAIITEAIHKDIPLDAVLDAQTLWNWLEAMVPGVSLPDIAAMLQDVLLSEKTLASLAGDSTEIIAGTIQDWIAQWIAGGAGQEKLAAGLAALLEKDKLYDWLAQHSTLWVQDNLTMLFHWVESLFLELLQDRQDVLTAGVEQALLNRMGLMMQMGYAMMSGGEIVAAIVDRLVHQKVPIFLSVKRRELETLLGTIWAERLSPIVLQLARQYLRGDSPLQMESLLQPILAQPAVQGCIFNSGNQVLQLVSTTPMVYWGKYINIHALLARPQMQLGFQWQTHSKEMVSCWQAPVQAFCAEKLHTITFAQLSRGYAKQIPLQAIFDTEDTREELFALAKALGEALSQTTPADWFHWDAMYPVLAEDMATLCRRESFREWLGYEAEILVLALAEQPDVILPVACRKELLDCVIPAVFATAELHGTDLLCAMQLSTLAETQLKQMDSAHLELVVRGFAGHYLVHIQNRGWLGAVFALPGMLLYLFG